MSRFLPSNASSPAKTQRSAVTARSVSDGRSCGRASPTSLSWQSSIENDRETSTSVPFLHLWLPPRVGVHSPPLTTQAPSNTTTTAAVAITPTSTPPTMDLTPTRVVVKDEEPGASASSCMDGTRCGDGALAGEVHVDASSAAVAPTNMDSKVTAPTSSEGTEERSQSSCRSGTTRAVRGDGGAVRGADAARGGASPDASPSLPRPVVVLRRRCGPPAVYATTRTAAAKASDHSEGRGDNNHDDDVSSSPSRSLPSALEVSRTLPSTYFHADASLTTTKAKTPAATPTTAATATPTTAEGVGAVSAAESQGSAQRQTSDCQSGGVALAKKKKAAAAPAGAAPTSIHRAPSLTELTSPQTHAAASQSRLLTHKSPPPPTSSATTATSAAPRLLSPTTDGVATTMTMAMPMVSAVGSESPASVLTASPAAPLAVLSNALTASRTPPFPPSPLTTTAAAAAVSYCGSSSYPPPPSISLGESKASARHGSAVNFFSCSDSPLSVPFLSAPNAWKTALDGGERHEDNVSVSPPPSARLLQPVVVAVAAAHAARTLHDEEEGERVDDHKEAGEEGQEATTAKLASNVEEEPTLADMESASVPEKAAAPTQLTQPPLFASQAGRRPPSSAAADAHTTVVPATPLAKKQAESGGLCQTFAAMADIGVRLRSSSRSFSPSSPSSSSFPSSRISCGSPLVSRDVCGGEGGDDASDTEHNTMVWPASTTAVAVVDSVEHTEPHVNHRDHAGNHNNNNNNNNRSSRSRQQQQSRRSVCSSMDVDAVSSASPSPSPVARSPAAPSTMRRNNGSQVNTNGVLRGKHPTAAPRSVSHHTSAGSGSKAAHRAKDQRSNTRGTRHPQQQQQQQHHHHPSQHPSSLNVTANRTTTTTTSRGQSPAPGAAAAGVSPAAAVAPAHSKSNLMARLYAPPMTTPLTSMRYVPRTRDEEIELAELQQRLSAFVFPPAPHHHQHHHQQSHHRRVASPAPSSASAASQSRSASPACYAVSEKSSPPPPPPSKTTAAGATAKTTKKDEKTSPSVEPRDAFSRRRSSLSLARTGPRVTRKAAPIASTPLHTRGEQKRETTQLLH